ncbi:MAG: hypothetical protein MHM6MM_002721 [Cercozoa sp. M6MM]
MSFRLLADFDDEERVLDDREFVELILAERDALSALQKGRATASRSALQAALTARSAALFVELRYLGAPCFGNAFEEIWNSPAASAVDLAAQGESETFLEHCEVARFAIPGASLNVTQCFEFNRRAFDLDQFQSVSVANESHARALVRSLSRSLLLYQMKTKASGDRSRKIREFCTKMNVFVKQHSCANEMWKHPWRRAVLAQCVSQWPLPEHNVFESLGEFETPFVYCHVPAEVSTSQRAALELLRCAALCVFADDKESCLRASAEFECFAEALLAMARRKHLLAHQDSSGAVEVRHVFPGDVLTPVIDATERCTVVGVLTVVNTVLNVAAGDVCGHVSPMARKQAYVLLSSPVLERLHEAIAYQREQLEHALCIHLPPKLHDLLPILHKYTWHDEDLEAS